MGKSNQNSFVQHGLRHNKRWHADHALASIDRTMTPQYRDVIGPSPRTAKAMIPATQPRRATVELSPRQQRKRARLLFMASEQSRALSNADKVRAAERATINAARSAHASERLQRRAVKRATQIEDAIAQRDRVEGMAWFVGQVERLVEAL